ncbi:MAG: hypothetical protein IT328_04610 [Caldilineaceae bacterium]|nr:hypothetical protein [Caldilineaceae bacterium]
MPSGFTWTDPPSALFPAGMEVYVTKIHVGVKAIAEKWAPEIENWMRANAPWTDRTANARQSLWSDVNEVVGVMVEIIMAHGVEYGTYLEGWDPRHSRWMQNAGTWAVVEPALDHFAPLIWADVVAMMR